MKISDIIKVDRISSTFPPDKEFIELELGGDGRVQEVIYIPKLNVFFTKHAHPSFVFFLCREYTYNVNFIKKIASTIFLLLICLFIRCRIWPKGLMELQFTYIPDFYPGGVGGKYRSRLLHASRSHWLVFPNVWAQNAWCQSCVSAFKDGQYGTLIPEIELAKKDGWYFEENIDGIPLNRINNNSEISASIQSEIISRQFKFSWHQEINDYINCKLKYIILRFDKNKFGDFPKMEELKKILGSVSNQTVRVTFIHGDLNPGNIRLISDGSYKLMDWETYGVGWWRYDDLVFRFNLRHASQDYLNKIILISKELTKNDFYLFLTEEFTFQFLESQIHDGGKSKLNTIKTFLGEI